MFLITDYIILGAFLYFFYSGWSKGFLKTLSGPVALIASCLVGYSHYQKTQNIAASLAICIVSPFIIIFLVSVVLKLWQKAVNDNAPLSTASRLAGSTFSFLWGGGYLAVLLILIAVLPFRAEWFAKAQKNVLASKSYAFVNTHIGGKFPNGIFNMKEVTSVLQDPAKLEKFESTEEFKAVREDARLKELFADEETAEQIRNKDYGKLLANPKMQAVFQDKELLKKIFALNKKIIEESSKEEASPKVIEVQPE